METFLRTAPNLPSAGANEDEWCEAPSASQMRATAWIYMSDGGVVTEVKKHATAWIVLLRRRGKGFELGLASVGCCVCWCVCVCVCDSNGGR